MKLKTIYELAVKKGLKEDQRSKGTIEEAIRASLKAYKKSKGIDREAFDKETLKHPYNDTRILNGTGNEDIKNVLVGIDIDASEVLLADRLREKGNKIDLIISHHPAGRAYAQLHKVMDIQPSLWEKYGLTNEVAQGIMKDRIEEVARGVAPANHARAVDVAKLLNIPFMCIHTAADNCVAHFLQKIFDQKKPKKLNNVLAILKNIPEYRQAMKMSAGPFLLIGEENTSAGKIFVDMTGGTSGPDKMFARLSQAGIKTIIGMHCKESGYKIAKSEFLNYVIAGHIASDNLGLNLLLDEVDSKKQLKYVECSGFKRVRHG
ncbi:MAG: NGG1p interacting factor NIF3 [Candidatus Omnitrophota bacterium]|nr:NGG1p interacting factor NIF3 [Candidatus Omnitrophota bacterium]MBU1894478.1 NGG1p interacting factor NIF3 [Candidatus Omnitrophota bacterium]